MDVYITCEFTDAYFGRGVLQIVIREQNRIAKMTGNKTNIKFL